ncbi:atrial natriuretic peptide receptor 2-like [Uloborus diversus]|uniref:atrial natriuretic peptide receptor 2-like n=1 Tax=Uloborus diversus TaxID=327109 RepID=UPI00240A56F7|nr:atrial natriuretic peptide receptor 2-like [Uloborus diversus]
MDVEVKRHFFVGEYELPLRIEVSSRTTHQLLSHIAKFLLQKIVGYPYVYLIHQDTERIADNATKTLQNISSCATPTNCSKVDVYGPTVMINLEVWLSPGFNMEKWTATGQIEDCGPLGPIGRSGWFVAEYTADYFWDKNNTIIDHYRAFKDPDIVAIFDLSEDEEIRRILNCSFEECDEEKVYRPSQCQVPGVRCATLLADYPASTFNLLQHEIMNSKLLVNVAWIKEQLEETVETRTLNTQHTLFFHRKPMLLSSIGTFVHVSFPSCEDDPSVCDFEVSQLEKVVWSTIKSNAPQAFHVLQKMQFKQDEYLELLKRYHNLKQRGLEIEDAACEWVKDKIVIWDQWIPGDVKNKTTLYLGGIFPLKSSYWKQNGVLTAARLAADAVNNNKTLLVNYNLKILERDGHCSADQVMNSFIQYVTNDTYRTMVGILGPACSDTVEPIAGVAKHFKTLIISYSAEGAFFDDRDKYPYFFRTIPENNQFRFVYLSLFKRLGYQRIAALTEDGQKYPEYLSRLQELMLSENMEFIDNKKFPRDKLSSMEKYLKDLKNKSARIIIGDFYDYAARFVMCAAYHQGMTAENGFVWFLPPWFSEDWFKKGTLNSEPFEERETVNCTTEQMIEAINGHLSLSYKFYADNDTVMQEGKTVGEWLNQYGNLTKEEGKDMSRYGGYAYDAVWVYALALDSLFKEYNSSVANLHSEKTATRMVELINDTYFVGVTGPVQFEGSGRVADVLVLQWLNQTSTIVGIYDPATETLELNETKIVWLTPNGKKPPDGSPDGVKCSIEGFRRLFNVNCETAVVIANIVGVASFAVVFLAFVFFCKHRYEQRIKLTELRMKELGLMANPGVLALDEWEMPRDHIVINRKLGEGAFGTVYGGEAYLEADGWIAVAVKTLKSDAKPEEKLDFLSEAEVMKQFVHINIVKLVGVCTMGEPVYTVMEFMLYGDLKTYLLSRRYLASQEDRMFNDEVSDKRLTNMALDIARGLSYLADLKFVHRDLACRNCLVNSSRSVKIADFGMCRAMYDSDYYRYNKKGMLPIRWMAPESLIDGLFTPMSDVWSYGVVLYEIITFASFPYQGLSNNQVLEHIKDHHTLRVPNGVKPELHDLLLQCWERIPESRPQAAEIVEILGTNPELISPSLDVPMASVQNEDTGEVEFKIHERNRIHSLSSVWQGRRSGPPMDPNLFDNTDCLQIISSNENGNSSKGVKFSAKSFHESFKKSKKNVYRKRSSDIPLQSTYL